MEKDPYESKNIVDKGKSLPKQKELAALWNSWNKDNKQNILYQSKKYLDKRKAFYDDLYKGSLEQAKNRKPLLVK